jgi:hypothetical protein
MTEGIATSQVTIGVLDNAVAIAGIALSESSMWAAAVRSEFLPSFGMIRVTGTAWG